MGSTHLSCTSLKPNRKEKKKTLPNTTEPELSRDRKMKMKIKINESVKKEKDGGEMGAGQGFKQEGVAAATVAYKPKTPLPFSFAENPTVFSHGPSYRDTPPPCCLILPRSQNLSLILTRVEIKAFDIIKNS